MYCADTTRCSCGRRNGGVNVSFSLYCSAAAAARLEAFTCRQQAINAPPYCALCIGICVTVRLASIKSINASRVRRYTNGIVYLGRYVHVLVYPHLVDLLAVPNTAYLYLYTRTYRRALEKKKKAAWNVTVFPVMVRRTACSVPHPTY